MNQTQILYFLTVAKHLNFSEASRQLYVSQSSISKQINLLEEEFAVKLFERTNKYVRLTAAGDILYHELGKFDSWILSIAERAHNADAGLAGTLNICVLHNVEIFNPNVSYLHEFATNYPDVSINLRRLPLEQLDDYLTSGQSDVAITLSSMIPDIPFSAFELRKTSCYIAISKKIKPTNGAIFNSVDFSEFPFITIAPKVSVDVNVEHLNILNSMGITPRNIRYVQNMDDMLLLLEAGFGYTLINNMTLLYKRDTLQILNPNQIAPPPEAASVIALWSMENTNPVVKTYIDFLQKKLSPGN